MKVGAPVKCKAFEEVLPIRRTHREGQHGRD